MSHDDHVPPFPKTYPKGITYEETLRDQFAMAALQGWLAGVPDGNVHEEAIATRCYKFADAMIRERAK